MRQGASSRGERRRLLRFYVITNGAVWENERGWRVSPIT